MDMMKQTLEPNATVEIDRQGVWLTDLGKLFYNVCIAETEDQKMVSLHTALPLIESSLDK